MYVESENIISKLFFGNNRSEFHMKFISEKEEQNCDFNEFLRSHIDLVRQDEDRKKYIYEVSFWLLLRAFAIITFATANKMYFLVSKGFLLLSCSYFKKILTDTEAEVALDWWENCF